jgi:hypothetical protein
LDQSAVLVGHCVDDHRVTTTGVGVQAGVLRRRHGMRRRHVVLLGPQRPPGRTRSTASYASSPRCGVRVAVISVGAGRSGRDRLVAIVEPVEQRRRFSRDHCWT